MLARIIRRFADDDTGGTAIEYALLGTIIAVALAASFSQLGGVVGNMFGTSSSGAIGAISNSVNKL